MCVCVHVCVHVCPDAGWCSLCRHVEEKWLNTYWKYTPCVCMYWKYAPCVCMYVCMHACGQTGIDWSLWSDTADVFVYVCTHNLYVCVYGLIAWSRVGRRMTEYTHVFIYLSIQVYGLYFRATWWKTCECVLKVYACVYTRVCIWFDFRVT